jgi:hypothetical protein
MLRYASILLFLLRCLTALPQAPDRSNPDVLKLFHDDALNISYFYPSRFVPVPPPASKTFTTDMPQCLRTTLFANSVSPIDISSFALSTVDNTCPDFLRRGTQLGPFIRDEILHELKQYGEPSITQEPTRYNIDGRPAAIILASVPMPEISGKSARRTYAAKACALASIPANARKKNSKPVEPAGYVLCFDFMTQNSDLLNLMFSFIVQFDNDPSCPCFPPAFCVAVRTDLRPLFSGLACGLCMHCAFYEQHDEEEFIPDLFLAGLGRHPEAARKRCYSVDLSRIERATLCKRKNVMETRWLGRS